MPKVSIIVAAFNSEQTIAASLNSLLRQTLGSIEIIIVNDGSQDNTKNIIDSYAAQNSNICVINLSKNVGVHEARAIGIKHSSAQYVGYLDADDIAYQHMFKTLYEKTVATNSDITICSVCRKKASGRVIGKKVKFSKEAVIQKNIFVDFCKRRFGTGSLWNKLYKKELIYPYATRSFLWRQDAGEDTLVNIGCFLTAKKICLISDILMDYILNPDGVSQLTDNNQAFVRIFRAFAVAVLTYRNYGLDVLANISMLYAPQLDYPCYHIKNIKDIVAYKKELSEAVELLAKHYPLGLAYLASRQVKTIPKKRSLKNFISNIVK